MPTDSERRRLTEQRPSDNAYWGSSWLRVTTWKSGTGCRQASRGRGCRGHRRVVGMDEVTVPSATGAVYGWRGPTRPLPHRPRNRTRLPHPLADPPPPRQSVTFTNLPASPVELSDRRRGVPQTLRRVDPPPTPPLLPHPSSRSRSLRRHAASQKPAPGPTYPVHLHAARCRSSCPAHRQPVRQSRRTVVSAP